MTNKIESLAKKLFLVNHPPNAQCLLIWEEMRSEIKDDYKNMSAMIINDITDSLHATRQEIYLKHRREPTVEEELEDIFNS